MIAIRARDPRDRGRRSRPRRQSAEARAAHGRGGGRRRVDAPLFARARGVSAPGQQAVEVLAAGGARGQRVRRPQPLLQLHSRDRARDRAAPRAETPRQCAIVIVLGAGVVGVTAAWYLRAGRARGHGRRPPRGRGARDVVRQRRADLGVVRGAVGQSRRAARRSSSGSGRKTRRCCSACASIPRQWRWGLQFLIECLPSRTRRNTIQCLQPRAVLARLPARRCARRPASRTTISSAASSRSIPTATEFAHGVQRRGADARVRLRPRRQDGRRMRGDRAGARVVPRQARRRHLHRERRVGRRAALHAGARAHGAARGVHVPLEHADRAARGRDGDAITSVRCVNEEHRKEILRADAYVVALGSYSPFLLQPLGVPCLIYPAEGLFGHHRHRRSPRRADGVAHRPRLQDRVHAPGRPPARRRHGRAVRATART